MLFNVFANKVKDAALEQVAKWLANRYHLKRLGRIRDLKVNSAAEEVFVVFDLHGEHTPIELTAHYRIISSSILEIVDVKASREWIAELINHVIPPEQKRVEVSPAITRALSKLE